MWPITPGTADGTIQGRAEGRFLIRPQLIPTKDLLLDAENYRLPASDHNLSQKELIELLVVDYKADEIAESISRVGYLATESLAAIKSIEGKYIVVEGNRRLAACLCLLSPDRAPESKRSKFRRLHDACDSLGDLKKLPVVVLPDRAAADVYLVARHTRVTARKWNPLMQARFYAAKLEEHGTVDATAEFLSVPPGAVRDQLRLHSVVSELRNLGLPLDVENLLAHEVDFLSTLMRLFNNEDSRKRMRASFDDDGSVKFAGDRAGLKQRMTRLLHALNDGAATSRTLNTAEQRDEFLADVGFPVPPPDQPEKQENEKQTPPGKKEEDKSASKGKTVGRPTGGGGHLFNKTAYVFLLSNENVSAAYDELTKVSVKGLPRATALLLRCVIELALLECLETSKEMKMLKDERLKAHEARNAKRLRDGKNELAYIDEQPVLSAMLNWITSDKSAILGPSAKKALRKQVTEDRVKDVLDLANHSNLYYVDESKVRDVWKEIGPSLFEQIIIQKRSDAE